MSADIPIRRSANTNRSMTEFIKQREGRAVAIFYNSAELADPEGKQINRPRRFTTSSAKVALQAGRTTQISLTAQTELAATNPQFAIVRNPFVYPVRTTSSSAPVVAAGPPAPVWPAQPAAPPTGLNSTTEFNDYPYNSWDDAFLVKYNSSGIVQWASRITGYRSETPQTQVCDSNGNVYIACFYDNYPSFGGTKIYNSDGTLHTTLSSGTQGYTYGFVAKYDTNGMVQFVLRLESSAGDTYPYSLQVDSNGNIYVLGFNSATVTIYNANGTTYGNLTNSTASRDAFLIKYNSSGVAQWTTKLTDTGNNFAVSVDVDSSANIYITGFSPNTVTVYNQDGSTFGTITNTSTINHVYIVKYNTSGVAQWATNLSASTSEGVNFLKVDSTGNVYLVGYFDSTITINNANSTTFGTLTNTGSNDGFLIKYNSSGIAQWATKIGGTSGEIAWGAITDTNGNVYLCGYFGTGAVVYNKDGTTFASLTNAGGLDGFLVKYDSSGFAQWAARISGSSTDIARSVSIDANNNICLAGQFISTSITVYNKDGTSFGTITGDGSLDVVLIKYDTNGFVQWTSRMAGPGNDYPFSISSDSNSNLYVSGVFKSNPLTIYNSNNTAFSTTLINQNPSNTTTNAFLVKYYSNGTIHWAVSIGDPVDKTDTASSVYTDTNGNVYVVGTYNGAPLKVYNEDGSLFGTLTNTGVSDNIFLIKYNSNGIVQWATRLASTSGQNAFSVVIDNNDNIYVGGFFSSNDFTIYNANGTTFGTLTNIGSLDAFIVKYNSSGIGQWATKIAGSGNERVSNLATDSQGNIFAGLNYGSNPITFYNKDGTVFGTVSLNTSGDILVVKYDTSGFAQWYSRIASTSSDWLFGMNTDYIGNVYAVGYYQAALSVYNQDNSLFSTLPFSGSLDAYVVKYNASGTAQWASRIGGTGDEFIYSSSADLSGNQYVLGVYSSNNNTIIYNKDGTTFATFPTTGFYVNIFLIKYNTDGMVLWCTRIIGGDKRGYGMICDSFGNIYITGETTGVITIYNKDGTIFGSLTNSGGNKDAFIIKYNVNGTALWAARLTGNTDDTGKAITSDINGNIYVVGESKSNPITFNKQGV